MNLLEKYTEIQVIARPPVGQKFSYDFQPAFDHKEMVFMGQGKAVQCWGKIMGRMVNRNDHLFYSHTSAESMSVPGLPSTLIIHVLLQFEHPEDYADYFSYIIRDPSFKMETAEKEYLSCIMLSERSVQVISDRNLYAEIRLQCTERRRKSY